MRKAALVGGASAPAAPEGGEGRIQPQATAATTAPATTRTLPGAESPLITKEQGMERGKCKDSSEERRAYKGQSEELEDLLKGTTPAAQGDSKSSSSRLNSKSRVPCPLPSLLPKGPAMSTSV